MYTIRNVKFGVTTSETKRFKVTSGHIHSNFKKQHSPGLWIDALELPYTEKSA
jgi:hypothetical protein